LCLSLPPITAAVAHGARTGDGERIPPADAEQHRWRAMGWDGPSSRRIGAEDGKGPRMQPNEKPSLYDRLGGVYNIATVVDDLIDRIMVDPRLNANPRVDEAHHRVSPAGFKYLVTEMVCGAAGGPQQYSGRSMGDSHRHLMITEEEWHAFMDDFQ